MTVKISFYLHTYTPLSSIYFSSYSVKKDTLAGGFPATALALCANCLKHYAVSNAVILILQHSSSFFKMFVIRAYEFNLFNAVVVVFIRNVNRILLYRQNITDADH